MNSNIDKKIFQEKIDIKNYPELSDYINNNPDFEKIFNLYNNIPEWSLKQLEFTNNIKSTVVSDESNKKLNILKNTLEKIA